MSECVFKAKTSESSAIKNLVEFLKPCLKQNLKMKISEHGIIINQENEKETTLVDACLNRDDFDGGYYFNSDEDIFIGIDLAYLQRILKPIKKKKDVIEFSIMNGDLTFLNIEIQSNGINKNSVPIYKTEKHTFRVPKGYNHPKVINSDDFKSDLKQIIGNGSKTKIEIQNSEYIRLSTIDICSSEKIYGELNENEECFTDYFYNSDLKVIHKLSNLSNIIKISSPTINNHTIKISSKIGSVSIGNIDVYIQSSELIDSKNK